MRVSTHSLRTAAILACLFAGRLVNAQASKDTASQKDTGSAKRPVSVKDTAWSYKPILTIFGSATLKNVVADTSGATSTTGSIGVMYETYQVLTTGMISVAGKADTAHGQFGGTLLPTSSGGSLNAGSIELRVHRVLDTKRCRQNLEPNENESFACGLGFRILGSASTGLWDADMSAKQNTPRPTSVPVWGTQWNASYTFVDDSIDNSRVWMIFDFGLATRHMRGDLTLPQNRAFRDSLLKTTQTDFYGPMAQLTIRYGDIYAGLAYYYFGGSLAGLNHGQVVAGIALQANLLAKTIGGARKAKTDSAKLATLQKKALDDSVKKVINNGIAHAQDSLAKKVKEDSVAKAKLDNAAKAQKAHDDSVARAAVDSVDKLRGDTTKKQSVAKPRTTALGSPRQTGVVARVVTYSGHAARSLASAGESTSGENRHRDPRRSDRLRDRRRGFSRHPLRCPARVGPATAAANPMDRSTPRRSTRRELPARAGLRRHRPVHGRRIAGLPVPQRLDLGDGWEAAGDVLDPRRRIQGRIRWRGAT